MRTLVIHHNDLDGVASAAIAGMYEESKGRNVEYYMFNYGQAIPDVRGYDRIFVLDVSFGQDTRKIIAGWAADYGVLGVWIDHHKTIFKSGEEGKEEYFELFGDNYPFGSDPAMVPGLRRVGTAACELTWEYLHRCEYGEDKDEKCPKLIQYLGTYDVWDKDRFDWDDVMQVQYGSRLEFGLNPDNIISWIKETRGEEMSGIISLAAKGRAILGYINQKDTQDCSQYAFEEEFMGYKAICMNTTAFNSTTFDSVWDEDKYDLMIPFCYTGKKWRFSLYTTKDNVDCGALAKHFGGGGHAKAAGFYVTNFTEAIKREKDEKDLF